MCLGSEGWGFQNHPGNSFWGVMQYLTGLQVGSFLQIALQTSDVFYLALVFLATVWLRDVAMDIKCRLLFFLLLPASHHVEHSHLIVMNLSKSWNREEVPHGPLEIIITVSRRPTRVVFRLQLVIQQGIEKLWRRFKTISQSFTKIKQWNQLLPDAEWERTSATTGGISFLELLSQISVQFL